MVEEKIAIMIAKDLQPNNFVETRSLDQKSTLHGKLPFSKRVNTDMFEQEWCKLKIILNGKKIEGFALTSGIWTSRTQEPRSLH